MRREAMEYNWDEDLARSVRDMILKVAEMPEEGFSNALRSLDSRTLKAWARSNFTLFTRCVRDSELSLRLEIPLLLHGGRPHSSSEPAVKSEKRLGCTETCGRLVAPTQKQTATVQGPIKSQLDRAGNMNTAQQAPIAECKKDVSLLSYLKSNPCVCKGDHTGNSPHFTLCQHRRKMEEIAAMPERECVKSLRTLNAKTLWDWVSLNPTILSRSLRDPVLDSRMAAYPPGSVGEDIEPVFYGSTAQQEPVRIKATSSNTPVKARCSVGVGFQIETSDPCVQSEDAGFYNCSRMGPEELDVLWRWFCGELSVCHACFGLHVPLKDFLASCDDADAESENRENRSPRRSTDPMCRSHITCKHLVGFVPTTPKKSASSGASQRRSSSTPYPPAAPLRL